MPRVRIRNTEPLNRVPISDRLVQFITGGDTWTQHHLRAFVLTFFSFALIHATRKTLSTVKPSMIATWTHGTPTKPPLFPSDQAASEFLAMLDGGFLLAYSVGLFGGGVLGDRYNPRVVLSIGMWLSAIVVFLFGYATEYFHVYSKTLYAFLWISGGLFQSVAWPTEICIVGNWFGHCSRGAVMGVWSACASVGNIIGTMISSQLVLMGYQYAFAVNSILLFLFGFVVYCNLKSAPREVGLPDPIDSPDEHMRVIEEPTQRPAPISFWRAWLLPGVLAYSLAYACLKLVNYGFFFWLPFYLHSNFGWSEADADALSAWYDVGGIIAAIVAGAASDHFPTRTPIIVTMLVCSTFALWGYSASPPSPLINGILLTITGFFIGGPANMISSSVSADLGRTRELRGNAEALSTVTGIVDGTGSFGAALGQLLIPSIQGVFGWNSVFYGFIIMIICTAACLLPLLWREMIWRRRVSYDLLNSDHEDNADDEDDVVVADEDVVRRRLLTAEDSD
nr:Major facilitator superfamily MFS-1 domain containing protein [Haemonchus contortus]